MKRVGSSTGDEGGISKKPHLEAVVNPTPVVDPFPYGVQTFRKLYAKGQFFSDKTRFIAAIESLGAKGEAVLALFPRRFGKSVFLDTLAEYYDVRNAESFQDLFGHLHIGQHPTALHSCFMILRLNFSGLAIDSYDAFNASFDNIVVMSLARFRAQYAEKIDFDLDMTHGIRSFENLWSAIQRQQREDPDDALGLYILVDEYDNSVMKLATNPATAQMMRERGSQVAPIPSHFSRFWSAVKKAQQECQSVRLAVTGITPMVLTEFAGSGANHLLPLEFRTAFRGLFGLAREEVHLGLSVISPPLPEPLKEQLLAWIEKQMDGYRLEESQQHGLFNPARVMYCLSNLQDRWSDEQNPSLKHLLRFPDDTQTKPAESSLAELVVSRGQAKSVLSRLLGSDSVPCAGGIRRGFTLSKMDTSGPDLLSYLYFTGAITHAYCPESPEPRFAIPNEEARRDYIEASNQLLEVDESDLRLYQDAVRSLVDDRDVAALAEAFMAIDKNRTGHSILHSEAGFHEALFAGLALARRPADRVLDEPIVSRSRGEAFDIVYKAQEGTDKRFFYLELRNLCLGDGRSVTPELELPPEVKNLSDWHARAERFVEWTARAEAEIGDLRLVRALGSWPAWKHERWAPTVKEYVAKAAAEVRRKYLASLRTLHAGKAGEEFHVWVLVRVGVGIVLVAKCS